MYVCLCVRGVFACACRPWYVYEGQRTTWGQLSPSSMWVMEIRLLSSRVAAGAFAHGPTHQHPNSLFLRVTHSGKKKKTVKECYSSNTLKVDKRISILRKSASLAPLISQNCREIHKTVGCSQFQTPNRHLRVLKCWTICSNRCICIFVLRFIPPHMALY